MSRFKSYILVFSLAMSLLAGLGGGVGQSPTPAVAQTAPTFEDVDCVEAIPILEGLSGLRCGYLVVPENRANPTGNQVWIAVVIVKSFSDNPVPDPLLYLEGGPGGSGVFGVEAWLNHPLRHTRDIILFDQRGTGFSEPFLGCPELYEIDESFEPGTDVDELEISTELLAQCQARLVAEGVDLSQYDSTNSAADVADLRVALGIEAWNLLGVSYGTRLALTVMRDHPAGVRSVVLDSVYPPHVDAYEEQAPNMAEAILTLLDLCEESATCQAAYPDLTDSFFAMLDDLNEEPVDVEVVDFDGAIYDEPYYGDDIVLLLGDLLYDTSIIPYLPRMIDELSRRDTTTLGAIINQELEVEGAESEIFVDEFIDLDLYDEYIHLSDSDGLFYTVECREEVPFNTADELDELAEPYPDTLEIPLVWSAAGILEECPVWGVAPADTIENEPVRSAIPTLVLSGQLDPVTPPAWGFSTAEYLEQAYAYEFPGVGHGAIDGGQCPTSILLVFLDDPNTEPNASCIDDMPGPDWALPE